MHNDSNELLEKLILDSIFIKSINISRPFSNIQTFLLGIVELAMFIGVGSIVLTRFLGPAFFRAITYLALARKPQDIAPYYFFTPILVHPIVPFIAKLYNNYNKNKYPEITLKEYYQIISAMDLYGAHDSGFFRHLDQTYQYSHIKILIKMGAKREDFPQFAAFAALERNTELGILFQDWTKFISCPSALKEVLLSRTEILLAEAPAEADGAFLEQMKNVFSISWENARKVREQRPTREDPSIDSDIVCNNDPQVSNFLEI